MIIVTGTMEVPEEHIETAKKNFRLAEAATASERGCITYRFFQSVEQPGLFRVYEEWEDKDALREHGAHANMAAHRERMAPLGLTSRKIKMIEPERIRDLG